MDEFLGRKYIISPNKPSENFDEYLKFVGYNYFLRVAAKTVSPVHCLLRNPDGTYTFSLETKLFNSSVTFRLNEECDESKPGPLDEKLKSLVTMEGNVMTQQQTDESGKTITHVREFYPNKMITTTTVTGWGKVLTRYYDFMESQLRS